MACVWHSHYHVNLCSCWGGCRWNRRFWLRSTRTCKPPWISSLISPAALSGCCWLRGRLGDRYSSVGESVVVDAAALSFFFYFIDSDADGWRWSSKIKSRSAEKLTSHTRLLHWTYSFPFGAGLRFSLLGCFGKSTIVGATFGFCTLVFIV